MTSIYQSHLLFFSPTSILFWHLSMKNKAFFPRFWELSRNTLKLYFLFCFRDLFSFKGLFRMLLSQNNIFSEMLNDKVRARTTHMLKNTRTRFLLVGVHSDILEKFYRHIYLQFCRWRVHKIETLLCIHFQRKRFWFNNTPTLINNEITHWLKRKWTSRYKAKGWCTQ